MYACSCDRGNVCVQANLGTRYRVDIEKLKTSLKEMENRLQIRGAPAYTPDARSETTALTSHGRWVTGLAGWCRLLL